MSLTVQKGHGFPGQSMTRKVTRASQPGTQRRSRFGCRNCKLRKLKCDENKPQCQACQSFGVLCNFEIGLPDLQQISRLPERCYKIQSQTEIPLSLPSPVWICDAATSYQLNTKCQDFVTRYYGRSLENPNDPIMIEINDRLLRLAFQYPFLMHAMLAVALTYDRYLNNSSESRRTLEECDHWSRSTTLFNVKLRGPILDGDKDPVWGTAAAQVILTFASPDARTPEESWPLSPSSSFSDVDWVRMSDGKMSLWNIVNPLRPDSIFHVMSTTFQQMQSPLPEGNTDDLPPELLAMCHIDQWTNPENNPYLHAVSALSVIMNVPDRQLTMGQTQLFMRCIQGEFRDLLCAKDPAALLLLYLWFKKTGRSIWWIDLRARVECPAIRLYLTQHHGADNAIQAILSGKAAIGS